MDSVPGNERLWDATRSGVPGPYSVADDKRRGIVLGSSVGRGDPHPAAVCCYMPFPGSLTGHNNTLSTSIFYTFNNLLPKNFYKKSEKTV